MVDESNRLTYHYSKFINLQENLDLAAQATATAFASQGSAFRENAKLLDSIGGKMGILKASIEELWGQMVDSSTLKFLITSLTAIIKSMGSFNEILVKTGVLFLAWKGGTLLGFFLGLPSAITASLTSIVTAKAAIIGLEGATLTAATGARGFALAWNSLKLTFMANPIGLTLTAIAVAGVALYSVIQNINESLEDTIKAVKASNEAYDSKVQSIEGLTKAYEQNFELAKKDDKIKEQLIKTEDELRKSLGLTKDELNSQTKSLEDNIAKIKEKSNAQLKDYIDTNKLRVQKIKDADDKVEGRGLRGQGLYKEHGDDADRTAYLLKIPQKIGALSGDYDMSKKEYLKVLGEIKDKQDELMKNGVSADYIEYAVSQYELVEKSLNESKDGYDSLNKYKQQYIKESIEGFDKMSDHQKKLFTDAEKLIKDSPDGIFDEKKYTDQITKVFDVVKTFNGVNLKSVASGIQNLFPTEKIESFKKTLKTLADGFHIVGKSEEDLAKEQAKLDESYSSSINTIQLLQKAENELNKDHKLSESTQEGLLKKHAGLLDVRKSEAEQIEEIRALLKKEGATFEEIIGLKLSTSKDFFQSAIKGNSSLWKTVSEAYGVDLTNFETIAEAKDTIDSFLRKKISEGWADLYTNQAVSMGEMVDAADTLTTSLTADGEEMSLDQKMDAAKASATLREGGIPEEEVTKQIEKIQNMKTAIKKVEDVAKNARESAARAAASLGSVGDGKKKGDGTPADKNPEPYKNEKDDLLKYKIALEEVNILVEKNQAEQKNNSSYSEKVRLVTEEVSLLRKKWQTINDIAWQEKEQSRLKRVQLENPDKYGLKFEESGAYDADQYDQIVKSKTDIINNMKAGDAREAKLAELNDFKLFASQYRELRLSHYKSMNDLENMSGDIFSRKNEIIKIEVDELFKTQQNGVNVITNELDKLKTSYDALGENKFESKLRNINKQIVQQLSLLEKYDSDILDLQGLWWKAKEAGNQEEMNRLNEEANRIRKDKESLKKNIDDNKKDVVENKVSSLFYKPDKSIDMYNDKIKDLDFEQSSLDENDISGRMDVKKKQIESTNEQILILSDSLAKMNKQTSESTLSDSKFIEKKEELKQTLQATMLKQKEYTKNLAEEQIKSVEAVEDKIQDIIKEGIKKKKNALKEELDDYKKFINEKIEALDDSNNKEDYERDLNNELKKKQEIQDKINASMLDKTYKGFSKRKELQKELDEQDKRVEDLQRNRRRNLQKDSLQDSLKSKEETTNQSEKDLDKYWTEEKVKTEAHNALINNSFEDIRKQFPEMFKEIGVSSNTFFDNFKGYLTTFEEGVKNMGDTIDTEWLPKIQKAVESASKLKELRDIVNTGGSVNYGSGGKNSDINKKAVTAIDVANSQREKRKNSVLDEKTLLEQDKQMIGYYQRQYQQIKTDAMGGILTSEQQNQLKSISGYAQAIRTKNDWDYEDYSKMSDNLIQNMEGRSDGILSGAVTETKPYMLHGTTANPEWVLNNSQMKTFIKNMATKMIPSMGVSGKASLNGGIGGINLSINISGDADSSVVERVKEAGKNMLGEIKKTLNKNGIFR